MATFGENSDLVKCSFCGKSQKEVSKLIAGPGAYICNECVYLCNDIIEEEDIDSPQLTEAPASSLTDDQRRWREAHHLLAGRLGQRPTVSELAAELGWTQDRVTDAGRGACVATAGSRSTGSGPAGIVDALRGVPRQLDQLARRVAGLVEQARGDDSPE